MWRLLSHRNIMKYLQSQLTRPEISRRGVGGIWGNLGNYSLNKSEKKKTGTDQIGKRILDAETTLLFSFMKAYFGLSCLI